MAKRRKRAGRTDGPTAKTASRAAHPSSAGRRKGLWKTLLTLFALAAVSLAGLTAYKRSWDKAHDLSVLGNGIPTVVQVHEPSCAPCRSLKSNVRAALNRIDGQLQYRIADLNTEQGRRLAARHRAGMVTLLLFDGGGRLLDRHGGVNSVETLAGLFADVALPAK